MKILFKALRNSEDLVRVFNFCESHDIEIYHNRSLFALDESVQLEETSITINWGGYGSSVGIGENLFNYFQLTYPHKDPSRGKTFAHVKMVISGTMKNNNVEEIVQLVESLGGVIVEKLDDTVNLLVTGKGADSKVVKNAEKLDQVLILDEKRFVSILPAERKAPKKRKAKPKKEISLTVDKKVLNNLKKLLCSRDKNLIDQGHELLRSLGSAEASEYFLDGVSYTSQGEGSLIPSLMFTGTGPAQPFLNYAMLGVIAYAPEDCEAALALKKAITQLEMVLLFTEPLAEFKNLKSLDLSGSEELENLDGLSSLKKLKHIDIKGCTALKNLKGLLNKTLDTKVLDLSGFSQLESLEGLQSMPKIKEINLGGCGELKNIDALQGLTNLKDIDFGYNYEGYYQNITSPESLGNIKPFASRQTELNLSCDKLKSLNGIEKFSKLSELQISSDSLTDISSLKGLQSLKILNIYALQLKSLKGIESLPELKELSLSCKELKTLEGLKDLPALKQLTIPDDCVKMIDLKGIWGAPNITELFLHAGSLEDSTPIKHLVQLKNLDLSHCSSLRKFRGLNQLKNLKSITLNDCESLTTLDGVPGPHVFGDYQDFSNCSSLQDIRALKSSRIKTMHMDISGCSAIQKTQGLENIEINPLIFDFASF